MPTVAIDENVARAAKHLAEVTRAEAVALFGSRARGDNSPDSDWDLCVILPDDIRPQEFTAASLWREASRFGAPIQVYPIHRSVFLASAEDRNSVSYNVRWECMALVGGE